VQTVDCVEPAHLESLLKLSATANSFLYNNNLKVAFLPYDLSFQVSRVLKGSRAHPPSSPDGKNPDLRHQSGCLRMCELIADQVQQARHVPSLQVTQAVTASV
jgi:hypothetical protein